MLRAGRMPITNRSGEVTDDVRKRPHGAKPIASVLRTSGRKSGSRHPNQAATAKP